jgi:thiamine biosynthesis lipoprotein
MYQCAQEINRLSHGAFDITVAPLVNAWGFGFTNRETATPELIDSLRRVKNVLDASAIAKGQACDVVAQLLKESGSENYLVDIGGEVVLHGVNDQGEPWRVGITKPVDDPTGEKSEIQEVIASTHLCMATSGNYRQFYYENGLRRSHTIDPRTGYPVNHNLLSATVIAPSCMRADALATACMVLGVDSAMMLVESLPDTECYLIYSPAEADTLAVIHTAGFPL